MRVQTFSRAQILQEFQLRCQSLAANNNRGFKQEFEDLNDVGKEFPSRAGDLEANREKNRYPYILPYDHCRVRLSLQHSQPHSDYINANFVPGGGSERDFICTQGPLRSTMADFWRMVWEQNVRIIVMVTALRHKDTVSKTHSVCLLHANLIILCCVMSTGLWNEAQFVMDQSK
ncbi:receptor-type tyrosine-protein phosphatase V-like [Polymixia lowei]